jgi:HD-GYP domain-containing protein (c-di-GMP phosphodiesterase class II)
VSLPIEQTPAEDAVVAKLIEIQRLRDRSLASHGRRTAEIAVAIGGALDCDVETLDRLYLAGQIHDIGKLAVAEETLWKPVGLNHGEWREIRTHPEEGHRLVAEVVHRDVAAAVLYHHERLDRGGYPFGIDARSAPLLVRVISVADAFDAMTAGRPYQMAIPVRTAVEEIERCAGAQFDPDVADALRRVMLTRGHPRFTPTDEPETPEIDPEPTAEVIDLTDSAVYGPPDPSPADPFEHSTSMTRLRRSG